MNDIEKAKKYSDVGVEYGKKGEYDKAIEDLTEAIKLYAKIIKYAPDYVQNYVLAYNNKGIAYAHKGEHGKAIEELTKAIKLKPDFALTYNNRGIAYGQKSDYDKAITDYTKAIEFKPDYAEAYYNRGTAYAHKGDCDSAIKDFTKAIEFKPDYTEAYFGSASAYYNQANAYYNEGEYDKAIEDYTKAIAFKDSTEAYYYNRANAYFNKGEYDKAIEDYTKAIELKPDFAEAYCGRANVYFNEGEYDNTIENSTKAIKLNPKLAEAYNNRGGAYFKKGDYDKAINNCTKAIELKPDGDRAYINRANAYYEKGDYVNAIEDYKGCLNICTVDYSTSMLIYKLRCLLKEKALITDIDELTKLTTEYIKKIVEVEHDKNEEEIKEYNKNNDESGKVPIRDEHGNIILYQYSPYNKNAIYKIKQREMYFSNPSTFNDPFDPLIRVLSKEHSKGLMELLNFRVSCLSPQIDNLLLWSHYADKHQGICVAYDITKLVKQKNVIFRKIEHKDTFPKPVDGLILALSNTDSKLKKSATLINTFTQKQKVWDYEDEYRLILQTDKEEEFLQEVTITEIYLGRDMPQKDKDFIYTMVREMNLKKDTEAGDKYDKEKDDIKVCSMDVSEHDIFKLKPTPIQPSLK